MKKKTHGVANSVSVNIIWSLDQGWQLGLSTDNGSQGTNWKKEFGMQCSQLILELHAQMNSRPLV